MPANDYYDSSGNPGQGSSGTSALVRAEFDAVEAGFNKMPALTGNANRVAHINAGGTALTSTAGFTMSAAGLLTLPNGLTITNGGALIAGGVTVSVAAVSCGAGLTVTAGLVNLAPPNVPVTISPTGTGSVVISPTGTGGLTINPSTASTMDNVAIGGTTRAAGKFTTLDASGNVTLSPTGSVTIGPSVAGALNNVVIGATTPLAVTATTLTATGLLDISGAGAGQLKFPAAQNASADANTLDDYEEGFWTPGISFGGGTTGIIYNTQVGYYRKIGAFVFCSFLLDISDRGISAGNAKLTGLPFSDANGVGFVQLSTWTNLATACISVSGFVDAGATTCSLTKLVAASTSNQTFMQNTDIGNSGSLLRGVVIFKV